MVAFKDLLSRAGISKAELSRRLGLNPRTISSWKNNPPKYAIEYLLLLIEFNRIAP